MVWSPLINLWFLGVVPAGVPRVAEIDPHHPPNRRSHPRIHPCFPRQARQTHPTANATSTPASLRATLIRQPGQPYGAT
ncbi:uncharacterized protein EI90DRAFT_3057032 [Cantharellus anzutake]|uniref:uncharacterized protein n=1 Tax=Cantharellus anzutake TaxID=1750568 RepID=UPI00190646EC|nr:uncharacterized protein EI90DRAFT_3057032 [Cantharellus anzutake]KAF8331709.1 hypothetical protein EI90DRAFT_3057032 [Cantharellus anzutake]